MRDRRLHAHAHQAARPIEWNPRLSEQRPVDAVAAAAIVRVELGAAVGQQLNHFGPAFVRRAMQSGAAVLVGDVGVDAQVQAELDGLHALLRRPFEGDALHPADAGSHRQWRDVVSREDRRVGAERCVLSTDLGQTINPPVVEGFAMFAQTLLDGGFTGEEIRRMAVTNPAAWVE
jgi:hypothetical protein